jgi:hypothetical protein
VRVDSPEPGPLAGIGDDIAHATRGEMPVRRFDPDKNRSALGAGRPSIPQIFRHCFADVGGQWEAFDAVPLAAHDDLAGPPVDIVQLKLCHFAGAHAEADQYRQYGDIPTATARMAVA